MRQVLRVSAAAVLASGLLVAAAASAGEPERVQLQPRLEALADGSRELVVDASIEPGWILYASDFEQPQIGPRVARLTLADKGAPTGPLRSISSQEGHGRGFGGAYRYTYFSERGQLRLPVANGSEPVNATLRAQVCFEESGLCELLQKEIVAR